MTFTIFNCPLFTLSKKWNTGILTQLVIEKFEQVAKLNRTWNLAPVLQIIQKILENCYPCIYQLTKFGDFMSCGSKDIFRNAPCLMTNTHHDITDLVNHGIVENTKTWISWEQNITFLQINLILIICVSNDTFLENIIL